jgi:hypothetical protein
MKMSEMHLGQYRDVTNQEAALDRRVLKRLFRYGRQTAADVGRKVLNGFNRDQFEKSLARLTEWQMIEVRQNYDDYRSRWLSLTGDGAGWAEELVGDEQITGRE